MVIVSFLVTSSLMSGMLKQPSLKVKSLPSSFNILAFIKTFLNVFRASTSSFFTSLLSLKGSVSTINSLISSPICGAASPTPVSYTHLDVYKRQAQ